MDKPRFLYCCQCGGPKLRTVSNREFECEACGFKHFINPTVAVAAILANKDGEILLIRRAKNPGLGQLSLPGGFVDPGETGEEAIAREVLEEVSLTVSNFNYLASFPNEYSYQGVIYPVLDVFFVASTDSFSGANAMAEVQSLEIALPADLQYGEIAFPSVARALRMYAGQSRRG